MHHRLVSTAKMRNARNTSAAFRPRVEELEGRVLLAAYYVSPSGNDSSNGTSQSTPWKTIGRVNAADLNPGDSVNFQGGATFTSSTPLTFTEPVDISSATNPVIVTSYGAGRATLSMTGNTPGILGQHVSGYEIRNLIVKGSGWSNNTASGIQFYAWKAGALQHLHIDNVEVSGFGWAGIQVQASTSGSTYQDIQVSNSNLSGNKFAGFETIGPGAAGNHSARVFFDVHLADLRIYNNAGISFGSVYGGIIERSISANNGYTGDVATGIFVYDSSYITIRNNELYGMQNFGTNTDGNGITLDYGSDHCIVEGNYTHDNGGAGILLVGSNQADKPPTTHNTIRYNISEKDGKMYSFGAISLYRGVSNTQIYNNTVYSPTKDGFQIWDWKGSGAYIRNNIFITGGGPLQFTLAIFSPSNPAQKLQDLDLQIQGNNYYASGGNFNIRYGEVFYHSLGSFRNATGQEKLFGLPVGTSVNPQLNNVGGGGTLGDPALLDGLTAYMLQPRSRMRNIGLNLSALFGIDPGASDFFGNPLPSGPTIAVGAHDPADTPGRGSEGGDRLLGIVLPIEDPLNAPSNDQWSASMLTSQLELDSSLIAGDSVDWLSDASLANPSDGSGQRAALERPRGLGDAFLSDALAGAGDLG